MIESNVKSLIIGSIKVTL